LLTNIKSLLFKILLIFFVILSAKANEQLSSFISNLIPGEGLTETSIQLDEDKNPDLEILVVRDIDSTDDSNLFSQFSLHTQEINSFSREILNLGFGSRKLIQDKSLMYGFNAFWDNDFEAGHNRASIGFELKGSMLDFNANSYHALTGHEEYKGVQEQVLSGYTIELASQIPYSPWAKINWQNYMWDNEKSAENTEGNTLALEAYVTPSLQLIVKNDFSDNTGVDDELSYKLAYFYPPRQTISMQNGFSDIAFEKENVEKKLKEKVRRENNLTVEVQGSVVITSK
tara:strand:- start:1319 stop:2176 length:858 start_codon:yes stop_codon:yes gene_type:complete